MSTQAAAVAVKERPILFSSEMIRAILEGRKSMTRRVVQPGPRQDWLTLEILSKSPGARPCLIGDEQWAQFYHPQAGTKQDGVKIPKDSPLTCIKCPYGKPGERLWIREAWGVGGFARLIDPCLNYRADGAQIPLHSHKDSMQGLWYPHGSNLPATNHELCEIAEGWRPSIHMPRWASRINLEVTEVRVERLQDISEQDAKAEGIQIDYLPPDPENFHPPGSYGYVAVHDPKGLIYPTAREAFEKTWDSINGKRPNCAWKDNPWTWVVSFRRLES